MKQIKYTYYQEKEVVISSNEEKVKKYSRPTRMYCAGWKHLHDFRMARIRFPSYTKAQCVPKWTIE
jgi:hypothetical protein